jgi:hypothetical protein
MTQGPEMIEFEDCRGELVQVADDADASVETLPEAERELPSHNRENRGRPDQLTRQPQPHQ